jgi:hypothetical protein
MNHMHLLVQLYWTSFIFRSSLVHFYSSKLTSQILFQVKPNNDAAFIDAANDNAHTAGSGAITSASV